MRLALLSMLLTYKIITNASTLRLRAVAVSGSQQVAPRLGES